MLWFKETANTAGHKGYPQTVAVNIQMSNTIHSSHLPGLRKISRSLDPKEPLYHLTYWTSNARELSR